MKFTYDFYKRLKQSEIYLANPQKNYIGTLGNAKELKATFNFNTLNEASFVFYKEENGQENSYYDDITVTRLVEIQYMGWYQIQSVKENDDSLNPYKEISCLSLENELVTKRIDDINGVFALYDITETDKSLLHIITRACGWNIGHIDNSLVSKWRTFSIDSTEIYNLLTQDISKSFDCIFLFDTYAKTINAYTLANIGILTDIMITRKNIMQEYIRESDADKIVTKLRVLGGDGVDIRAVNPTGTNYLINVDYFKNTHWMSQDLIDALNTYQVKYDDRITEHTNTLSFYKSFQAELTTAESELVDLESQKKAKQDIQGLYITKGIPAVGTTEYTRYLEATNAIAALVTQIANKKEEIESRKIVLDSTQDILDNIGADLNPASNFSSAQLLELNSFLREGDEYEDSTFVAAETMTEEEIIEMKLELLSNGASELQRASQPQYTIEITASNLYSIIDDDTRTLSYDKWKEQLDIGNLITVKFRDDYYTTARLIKIEIDFDNLADLKLTFSDRSRLDDEFVQLGNLLADAGRSASTVSLAEFGWDKASKLVSPVQKFITSTLDATLYGIQSNDNQELFIDPYGLHMRKWLSDQNKYDDRQAWWTNNILLFSDDGFKTAKTGIGQFTTAIGETFYGFIGEAIVSNIIASEALTIKNINNTFIVDKNGALLVDADFTITRGNNTIILNPTEGFSIYKDSQKTIYLDSSGDANFIGHITASSITLTNAYNLIINNGDGTFTVSADGHIHATSGDIAGFLMDDNVLWAGEGKKYIRISSNHTFLNTPYASIDLGLSDDVNPDTGEKDTIIHLRSTGYARFGLQALEGSVKFNHDAEDFLGNLKTFTFYTKNFRIANDGLVTSTGINLRNGSPIRGYDTDGVEHNLVNFSPLNNVVVGEENEPRNTHIYGLTEIALYIGNVNNKAFIMYEDRFKLTLPMELNSTLDVTGDINMNGVKVTTKTELDSLTDAYETSLNQWETAYNGKVQELAAANAEINRLLVKISQMYNSCSSCCPSCPDCPECPEN